MKRKIIYTILVFLVSGMFISASAQESRVGITYNTALPLGNTADFMETYSWRGFGFETRYQVTPDIYMGISASWNIFYESEYGTFVDGTLSITGTKYKYVNAFPLMATVFKHFSGGSVTPYIGTGIGTISSNYRTEMGLFAVESKGWQFGLMPEAGILLPTSYGSDVLFSVRYNYGFKTTELDATSHLGINLGLLF